MASISISGRTRAASAVALASVASASATSASACKTCCRMASVSNIARTCPALTRSPSSTNTCSIATPFTLGLTLATSLALMVPSALKVLPIVSWLGITVSTDSTDCSVLASLGFLPSFCVLADVGDPSLSASSPAPQYFPSRTPMTSTIPSTGNNHSGIFDEGLLPSVSA